MRLLTQPRAKVEQPIMPAGNRIARWCSRHGSERETSRIAEEWRLEQLCQDQCDFKLEDKKSLGTLDIGLGALEARGIPEDI